MKFTLPLLLSLSLSLPSLVLTHPLTSPEVEAPAKTQTKTQITTTEHLATTAHFFTENAAAVISTENGLSTDACKPVIVIFARGTNEDGNVGARAGPPLFTELRAALTTAKITAQGVDYSATILGYLAGGDATGSQSMANLTTYASSKCPSAKIVLGGYSQGAQLVHNAAKILTPAITSKIAAVVIFGDPDYGQAVGSVASSKVLSICHDEDIICTGSGGFTTHLTYGDDAPTASAFIVKAVGTV